LRATRATEARGAKRAKCLRAGQARALHSRAGMKKNQRKLSLDSQSIRRLSDVQLVAGGLCGCSWTCTDSPNMCTITELAGGCHVTRTA
jgi:hypothetical protein